jgi:hypothetical protein
MNKHDEIKSLIKASRNMLSNKDSITESNDIRKQYGIINEQTLTSGSSGIIKRTNFAKSIEKDIDDTSDRGETPKDDKSVTWQISGGLMKVVGKTTQELKLTTDEKAAFQETMDEFVEEVSSLVDFNELIVTRSDVTWSGVLNDFNLGFEYRVNEENGVYFEVENLTKLSDEVSKTMEKLRMYYKKFKAKWSQILGNRKTTKIGNKGQLFPNKNYEESPNQRTTRYE